MNKYENLAKVLTNKGIKTFEGMQEYVRRYTKYDNWTYRDLDRTVALVK